MKLIQGEAKHHLPEDPARRRQYFQKLLRRAWVFLSSVNGLTIVVGAGLFLMLWLFLSSFYLNEAKYIDADGKSIDNYYAKRTLSVVDETETMRKRDRARQNVALIYKNPAPLNKAMLQSAHRLIQDVGNLTKPEENVSQSDRDDNLKTFQDMFGNDPQGKFLFDKLVAKKYGQDYWSKIRMITDETAQKILKPGLGLNDYLERRKSIIRKALPAYGLTSLDRELVATILDQTIQPNQVVDEDAMTIARKAAADAILPIQRVYNKGEKIIGKSEPVTALQKAALEKSGKNVMGKNWSACLGILFITAIFTVALMGYIYNFENQQYFRPSYVLLIGTMILITVGLFELLLQQHMFEAIPVYAFPLATLALTASIFSHHRISIVTTLLVGFLLALTLDIDFYSFGILLFGSMIGLYVLSRQINASDRGQLMFAGLYIGMTNIVMIIAIHYLGSASIINYPWQDLRVSMAWGFFSGFLSGVLTLGILPLLELAFRLPTPFTLMELANHDTPLLKRMQFEAPGTFHHSLMMASLAEAAAEAIGANPLLTRVGCLYHDIGKMKRPLFFVENQAYFGAENPHDKLTPRLSKMVITAHPRDSLELARQYKIPLVVQKFMTEHHGTMTAGYFYNKACQEEGAENVNKSQFRYSGPKPNIKETAIAMLADACESAVRSMKNPTVPQIEERIDKMIQQRVEDGQFDECPITFRDMTLIRETFLRVLRGIQHNRIEYQQSIMRDLGRNMQQRQSPEDTAKIQAMLDEVKRSAQSGSEEPPTKAG
ncbi:MAG: HD family phosphohydrolase [Candidatus Melainabacteria bacterium]